jgi:hypothetical protein
MASRMSFRMPLAFSGAAVGLTDNLASLETLVCRCIARVAGGRLGGYAA